MAPVDLVKKFLSPIKQTNTNALEPNTGAPPQMCQVQQPGWSPKALTKRPVNALSCPVPEMKPTSAPVPVPQPERTPSVKELQTNISRFVTLTPEQTKAMSNLSPAERKMYAATIDELDALKSGKINAAQFQANVHDHAADIAGVYGRLFVDLAGMTSSAESNTNSDFAMRTMAGETVHRAGSALESAYESVLANKGANAFNDGFNPNVVDNESGYNTVTHHYGAFLQVGANRFSAVGAALAGIWDSAETNPGDVRNGRFAAMLGEGAALGAIAPKDAARLQRWAYTDTGGSAPPWGNTTDAKGSPNHFTDMSNYSLSNWVQAFNTAHPQEKMQLRSVAERASPARGAW